MNIEKNAAVTIQYTVSEPSGRLLEQSSKPTAYLHGGYGNTFDKIEQALQGQTSGFATRLTLTPEEAFGLRDEGLAQSIPKSEFPPGVKVGGQLRGRTQDGREAVFNVLKIKGQEVMLDGNHPHAGKTLTFAIKVISVRAATQEEIAHGHVHGEHGHQHGA
ncbi:MAG: peptidylprolyl isomerase [Brachymonas sp.]|nr:peptidylprolyl isomerase [Brachymonas sp.]